VSKSTEDYRIEFQGEAVAEAERIRSEQEARKKVEAKLGALPPERARILRDAEQAVCSDRNEEYGEPIDNFGRWAGACNALGYRAPGGRDLKPHDLAVIMGLGKLSRSVQSPDKQDTWVDLAGYAAVGYELVTLED
jgi:hypothetical protein